MVLKKNKCRHSADAVYQLFNGTILLEGYMKDPVDFVKIMTDMSPDATK
jgi:hypothetical protein